MISSITFGILKHSISIYIYFACFISIPFSSHSKIIGVNKITASIIWRIYENHLHLAEVAFLQKFEDFQVVALDVEVLRAVPVHALSSLQGRRVLRMGLFASTMAAFLPTHVNS